MIASIGVSIVWAAVFFIVATLSWLGGRDHGRAEGREKGYAEGYNVGREIGHREWDTD